MFYIHTEVLLEFRINFAAVVTWYGSAQTVCSCGLGNNSCFVHGYTWEKYNVVHEQNVA
jgi:hypothetical protein